MIDRFRKNYTPITDEQKALGTAIKEKAEELQALIESARRHPDFISDIDIAIPEREAAYRAAGEANRCFATATTRLEESVMWAVKGAYTEIPVGGGN